jgi:hypothetical protein
MQSRVGALVEALGRPLHRRPDQTVDIGTIDELGHDDGHAAGVAG